MGGVVGRQQPDEKADAAPAAAPPSFGPVLHSMPLAYDRDYTVNDPAVPIPHEWWRRSIPRVHRHDPKQWSMPVEGQTPTSSMIWAEGVNYTYNTASKAVVHPSQFPPTPTWNAAAAASRPYAHVIQPCVRTLHCIDGYSHLKNIEEGQEQSTQPLAEAIRNLTAARQQQQQLRGTSNDGALLSLLDSSHSLGMLQPNDAGAVNDQPADATEPADEDMDAIELDLGGIKLAEGTLGEPAVRQSLLPIPFKPKTPSEAFVDPLRPKTSELTRAFAIYPSIELDRFHPETILVTDTAQSAIRSINLRSGLVEQIAGMITDRADEFGRYVGEDDGNGISEARFDHPTGVVQIARGVWLASDNNNQTIRRLTLPEAFRHAITEMVAEQGPNWSARAFFHPQAPKPTSNQHELVDCILAYLGPSDVTTIVGGTYQASGLRDGYGREALLDDPKTLVHSPQTQRTYIVCDHAIRILETANNNRVQTLELRVRPSNLPAAANESDWTSTPETVADTSIPMRAGPEPTFDINESLFSLTHDTYRSTAQQDVLILACFHTHAIFEIRVPVGSTVGNITWLAGARRHNKTFVSSHLQEQSGYVDGAALRSRFNRIQAICVDNLNGDILVADAGNFSIRLVRQPRPGSSETETRVYTLGGSCRQQGSVDAVGDASRFDSPAAIIATLCDLHAGAANVAAASSPSAPTVASSRPLPLHNMYVVADNVYKCGVRKIYVCDCIPNTDDPFILPRSK